MEQLNQIKRMITENRDSLTAAMVADLGRCSFEAEALDLIPVSMELDHAMDNLWEWMQPKYTPVPMVMSPATSETRNIPLGTVLIIGPFNYPISLLLNPLIGAICGGNCAVLKPSELTPECEKIMIELIPKYLDTDCFAIFTGDYKVSQELLTKKWNLIFFTGSTRVGRIVMEAAAKHLTPVLLELGGKSPVVVDDSITDIHLLSKRLIWGKLANNGQTCIAPDYVLCHESKYDELVQACKQRITDFYGENPKDAPDLGRVVSEQHTKRLQGLLKGCKATVVTGGAKGVDVKNKYVPPTLLTDVSLDSAVMQEEIFGPILPFLKYTTEDEVVETIVEDQGGLRGQPLALYLFSKNRTFIDSVTRRVQAGGVVVNDTLFGAGSSHLPFGGVGTSGLGRYHGIDSFAAFTHQQSVLRRHDWAPLDVPFRFPPYSDFGLSVFRLASKLPAQPHIHPSTLKWGAVIAVSLAAVYVTQGQLI